MSDVVAKDRHALVLSGGGARAAYQVGCLKYIARRLPEYRPEIITGISAGAINAIHLASHRGSWADGVDGLAELWRQLDTDRVFATDFRTVFRHVRTWALSIMSGGRLGSVEQMGMVDNQPLREFLASVLRFDGQRVNGVAENIADGLLASLAIITTNYGSGRSVAWIEGQDDALWERGQLRARDTTITLDHIMASSALPLFFPAVKLENAWHGDGNVRLTAPLSPAMHLGATRILAVSPRVKPTAGMPTGTHESYPSPTQIIGTLLNAVFLDMLDYDALQMHRINQLVARLPPETSPEFRQVEVMVLRPRIDLGRLAGGYEETLPRSFRFFERGLTKNDAKHADALSMVLFEPEYLERLVQLGEEDAEARGDEIEAFLSGGACALPVW